MIVFDWFPQKVLCEEDTPKRKFRRLAGWGPLLNWQNEEDSTLSVKNFMIPLLGRVSFLLLFPLCIDSAAFLRSSWLFHSQALQSPEKPPSLTHTQRIVYSPAVFFFLGGGVGRLLRLLSHFSHVRLCATPETTAHQAPPSLGFSR